MQTSATSNINMSPSKPPSNRTVTFTSYIAVRLMPSCKETEMTDEDREDICATYYSMEEVKCLQDGVLDDLSNMRDGKPENDSVTYRGIEHLVTPEVNQARRFRRRAVVDAVLIEQYRQWNKNDSKSARMTDTNAISMAASCLSLNDGLVATAKAKKDEEVARTICSDALIIKTDDVVQSSRNGCPASVKRTVSKSKLDFVLGATRPKRVAIG